MSNNPHQILFGVDLHKVERNEGEIFYAEGVRFTWKVKVKDTVSGIIDCLRVTDANEEWITLSGGETITSPIEAVHAFYNRTEKPARLLNISTQLHQAFFRSPSDDDSLRRH